MRRCAIVSVEEVRCVSTNSAAELTVTTSCAPATDSTIGSSAICPTVMVTPCTDDLLKPGAATITL